MQVSRIRVGTLFPDFAPGFAVPSRRAPMAPAYTRPVNRGMRLGQADQSKKPLSIPFADAQKMLASAQGIISQYPVCDLPVIDRFRSYVKAGQQTANLELSVAESTELDQFALCADTKGQKGGKTESNVLGLAAVGVAAAAIIGLLIWNA